MKQGFVVGAIVLAVSAGAMVQAQSARRADVQMKAAQQKAEVEGDLKGAIEAYKKIVASAGSDRALAAQALLRMADCYQKLGDAESQKLYQRITTEFADQSEAAAEARQRVTTVRPTPRPFTDGLGFQATITPDGRHFLVSYSATGDMAILDIAPVETNARRLIAKTGDLKDGSASWPVMSPDMRQVAFVWRRPNSNSGYQLRAMPNATGGSPRVLIDNANDSYSYFELCGWSADSKSILAILWKTGTQSGTAELAWVSSADGAVKVLRSFESTFESASRPRLAPDSKYIAYSVHEPFTGSRPALDATTAPASIHVLAADGSSETILTKTGVNEAPVWTPDGGHILFTSNRSGSTDLWSATVHDGKPVGLPSLVKTDIGTIRVIGFSSSGGFYYTHLTRGEGDNILMANLDPTSGHVRGAATLAIEAFAGSNARPVWSPDGKSIAFHRNSTPLQQGGSPGGLTVHSLETGEEKTFRLPDGQAGQPAWFQDGKTLLQSRADGRGGLSFYRVDVESGEFKKEGITVVRDDSRPSALSPDGKIVYTTDAGVNGRDRQAVRAVDLTTGRQTEIFSTPGLRGALPHIALSPDGRTLAMLVFSGSGDRIQEFVSLVGVDGGNFRNIYIAARGELHNPGRPSLPCVAWTKDGRSVLFPRNTRTGWELMRIPAAGGKPESIGLTGNRMRCMDLSPDGSRIVFGDGGANGSYWETLGLDNVLISLKK